MDLITLNAPLITQLGVTVASKRVSIAAYSTGGKTLEIVNNSTSDIIVKGGDVTIETVFPVVDTVDGATIITAGGRGPVRLDSTFTHIAFAGQGEDAAGLVHFKIGYGM